MLPLTQEQWWKSLPPNFPYGYDIPSQNEVARPHERSAVWAYLQKGFPADEAATQIMVIKPEDWDAYQDICGSCGDVHEHNKSKSEVHKDSDVAELLFEVAMAKPETIPKILDLIDAIEALPPYELSDEQRVRCPGWQDWSVKGSWKFAVREAYCSWDNDDDYYGRTDYQTPEELDFLKMSARRVAGLNTLMAYKAVYELDPDKLPSKYGHLGKGLNSLGLALEHDAWNHPRRILGDRPRIEKFDFRGLNELIITAMPWLTIAGHIFYRCLELEECRDWDVSKYIISRFGAFAYLYRGKPGLCFDRWNFWKERLEWIQKADLTEEAKVAAKKALKRMEAIEQGKDERDCEAISFGSSQIKGT